MLKREHSFTHHICEFYRGFHVELVNPDLRYQHMLPSYPPVMRIPVELVQIFEVFPYYTVYYYQQ